MCPGFPGERAGRAERRARSIREIPGEQDAMEDRHGHSPHGLKAEAAFSREGMVRRRWPENPGPVAHAPSTLEPGAPADRLSNKDPAEGKSQEHDRRDHPKDRPDDPAIARVERPGRMAVLRYVMAHVRQGPVDMWPAGLERAPAPGWEGTPAPDTRSSNCEVPSIPPVIPRPRHSAHGGRPLRRPRRNKKPRRSDRSHRGAAIARFKHIPLEQLNDSEHINSLGGRSIPTRRGRGSERIEGIRNRFRFSVPEHFGTHPGGTGRTHRLPIGPHRPGRTCNRQAGPGLRYGYRAEKTIDTNFAASAHRKSAQSAQPLQ